MRDFHPEFIIDSDKNMKSVILPINEWQEIINSIEELDDLQAYDKAMQEKEENIPFEQAINEINNG